MAYFDSAQQDERPFILAELDSRDRHKAAPVLDALRADGCLVTADDVSASDERSREERAARLKEAALVLLFASRRSLRLDGWGSAVTYRAGRRKPVIALYLDDARGTEGMQMQLSTVPSLRYSDFADRGELIAALKRTEGFTQELICETEKPEKKRARMRAAALALLGLTAAAVLTAVIGLRGGWLYKETPAPTPPPGVEFADEAIHAAVCGALGREAAAEVYPQELSAVNDIALESVPDTFADLALLTGLEILRVPQACVPECAKLLDGAGYTVIVEGAP